MTGYNPVDSCCTGGTPCPPANALTDEEGAVALAIGQTVVPITFLTQKATTNYVFTMGYIENLVDVNPLMMDDWEVTAKTVNGCTVKFGTIPDTANYVFRYHIRVLLS